MKFWKNWPYWLRGGVIGGGVTLLYVLLVYSCDYTTSGYSSLDCGLTFLVFGPIYPIFLLGVFFVGTLDIPSPFETLMMISVVAWLIIGALIGLLVGYLKSRKKNSVPQV